MINLECVRASHKTKVPSKDFHAPTVAQDRGAGNLLGDPDFEK